MLPTITAPSTSIMRYTKAVLFPFTLAPRALSITGTEAPMPIPIRIGKAMLNSSAPVPARAWRIPTAALALWMTAVTSTPIRTPSTGLLKLVIISMNLGSERSGVMAPDIMLMPYMRTANPSMMPPMFLCAVFFPNIQRPIPIRATTPVRTSVLNIEATPPPPPKLLRASTQPVMDVPRIAPSTMPIACLTCIIPEFTKPTTITDVADDDWITAVTPVPRRIPFIGFPASLYSIISILLPATFLSESPMTDIPKRNIATPPNKEIMLVASI